ncbi:MAG: hypothetical protein Q8L27_02670 [archaeon]|nr:hypothetical protein [archaeon]
MAERYKCPIEGAELERCEDRHNDSYYVCSTCNQEYSRYEVDKLEEVGQQRVKEARAEIKRINELKPKLEKLVALFEEHHPTQEKQNLDRAIIINAQLWRKAQEAVDAYSPSFF